MVTDNTNSDGQITGPTAQVFADGFESQSGWESLGSQYGGSVDAYDTNIKHSGMYSAKVTAVGHTAKYVHGNTWIEIDNAQPTEYIYSAWAYSDQPVIRLGLAMKTNEETGYLTDFDDIQVNVQNQWVYVEKKVVVPANIDKINVRIESFYNGGGNVWFDDVQVQRVDDAAVSEIREEMNYYPFGLQHEGYNSVVIQENNYFNFNGQELNERLGLNILEMTYRQYDPAIGRFNVVDPAAEIAGNWTPYRFGFDNPILFNDPLGLWEIRNGSWYTNDKKDMERFLSMLQIESDFYGGADISQVDKFIGEEFQGSGGRLSDGSILLDPETVKINKYRRSEGFSARQADHINNQAEKYGSHWWNEGTGKSQHWAYSYKYFRERSWYQSGQTFPGLFLGTGATNYASKFLSNSKGWYSFSQGKRYSNNFHGNQYTEKRITVQNWSKILNVSGKVLGAYGLYGTYGEWSDGKLSNAGAAYIGGVDGAALGSRNPVVGAWSLGTGIGKIIVESDWYFNTFQNRPNW